MSYCFLDQLCTVEQEVRKVAAADLPLEVPVYLHFLEPEPALELELEPVLALGAELEAELEPEPVLEPDSFLELALEAEFFLMVLALEAEFLLEQVLVMEDMEPMFSPQSPPRAGYKIYLFNSLSSSRTISMPGTETCAKCSTTRSGTLP